MANANDQRYVRTEVAIREAFFRLLGEMPLEKVSVKRLCDEAGISRNAFYLHYENTAALYRTLMGDLAGGVRAECLASLNRLPTTGSVDTELPRAIIDVLAGREELLRMLLKNDDGTLSARLAEEIEGIGVEAAASVYEQARDMTYGLYAAYTSWGPIGMVVRWLRRTDEPLTLASSMPSRICTTALRRSFRAISCIARYKTAGIIVSRLGEDDSQSLATGWLPSPEPVFPDVATRDNTNQTTRHGTDAFMGFATVEWE